MKLITPIVLILALAIFPSVASAEILLFSNDNKFHGCLDCSTYDSNSVCNRYGTYGNRYSSDSIWNRYGIGSRYDSSSPFNRYGEGLKMVDKEGRIYGAFSVSSSGASSIRRLLQTIWETSDGDYDVMRDRFCELDLGGLSTGKAPAPNVLTSPISVIAKPSGCRGYFLADGDSGGVYLLQWYGGHDPQLGDSILGTLQGYGLKTVFYPMSNAKGSVYVDDYMLSGSRAREKLREKCR